MKDLQVREAELLAEVQRTGEAFQVAANRCREHHENKVRECLEPVARDYLNALRAFSVLVLDGKAPKERLKSM